MVPTNPGTRKSERLEKKSAPIAAVRRKSERVVKEIPSPLRRSERTKNHASSTSYILSGSLDSKQKKQKKEKSVEQLMTFEAKEVSVNEKDVDRTARVINHRKDARAYRAIFKRKQIQENVKHPLLPSADAKVQELKASTSLIGPVKEPLEKNGGVQLCNTRWRCNSGETHEPEGGGCVEWSKGGNFKRKRVDQDPIVQQGFSCSTKSNKESVNPSATEDIESDDLLKKRRKITNNVVDQLSSKSEGEGKISTGNKEGNSGDSVERPAANNVESDEVRKLRDEQRCLHLLLKPEIAKLCEILHLPDNVKIIVDKFLEYVMDNHHVHREPVSILQAFQISLCWMAASLLKHKIDHKASLLLAKQHLNFDCKKEEVDYICSMLQCLKTLFLYRTGNSDVAGLPKSSELSKKLHSCTGVAPEVELAEKDISKSIKEIRKKCQKQLKKLHLKQREEKDRLNAIIKERKAEEDHKYKLESAAIRSLTPNNVIRKKKLEDLDAKYAKIIEDLKWQHEIHLKDLETLQLAARKMVQDREATWVEQVKSWAQIELLSILPSQKLGSGVEYFRTSEQLQAHNSQKNLSLVSDEIADGQTNKMVQTMARNGIGLSETRETISPVTVPHSNPVEVQTLVDNNFSVKEVDTMVPEGGSISRNEDHNRAKNASDSQTDIVNLHSHSKEHNSGGGSITADEREVLANFISHDCREDEVAFGLPSSVEEICDQALSDVPGREVAVEVHRTGSSTDGLDDVPTNLGNLDRTTSCDPNFEISLGEVELVGSQDSVEKIVSLDVPKTGSSTGGPNKVSLSNKGNLDGTTLFDPGSDISLGEVNALGSQDGVENITSLNSQSSEICIQSESTICMSKCENAAQIQKADDSNDLNKAVTLDPLLSEERIDSATVSGMPGTENLSDHTDTVVLVNPPSSVEQISDGDVINVLDRELSSRIHGTACPSGSPDTVALLNPLSSEQQIPDVVSISTPHGRVPAEVAETSHEVVECHNDRECQTDLDKSTSSFQQEGLSRTVNENMSQAAPAVSSSLLQPVVLPPQAPPISANEALQNACTSSPASSGAVDEAAIAGEIQHSSQQVEPVLCTVDVVPANQCNHESLVMEPPEQGQQLTSAEYPSSNYPLNLPSTTVIEHQPINEDNHSGGVPQESIEAPNQAVVQPTSNHESLVMEPPLQQQLLPFAEYPPSNQDPSGFERQPINKDNLSCCAPLESIEISNQAVVQLTTSLVIEPSEQGQLSPPAECSSNHNPPNLPSHTRIEHQPIDEDNISRHATLSSIEVPNQAVVQPASSSELDSYASVARFGTQSSDTRNMSTSEYNIHHPTQTASGSGSRTTPPLYRDPLQNELERIRKEIEQTVKFREDTKLQFKSEFEKEMEELNRKYEIKFHELEEEFRQRKKSLDANLNIVVMNKILAEAFRSKCMDLKVSNASGIQQDASLQPVRLSRQQTGIRPSLVASPSSCGIPAASLRNTSTATCSQTVMPTSRAAYDTSTIFSNVSTRPPHINSISPSSGNLQVASEIRAPAPHLQPYRRSTPMPAPSRPTLSNEMPIHQASTSIAATPSPLFPQLRPHPTPSAHQSPSNVAATPPSVPQLRPRPTLSTYYSDPHNRGHRSDRAGGLPTANLSPIELRMDANSQSGTNLPNILPRLSDGVTLNGSQFGTGDRSMQVNSAHQATSLDVVYLSDDD
ncbi:hypothetical protein L6164_019075 [Bauhinia variegata]|uniref:Uncharacterized protein n=1 Tax=Bauhinia variegata TaxID=167791 RepID=A0ACB9ND59_BAUVA|nr:hypothetical protein L6164_019075 [Bauhinia variegata]